MADPFDLALARFISRCPYIIAVQSLATKWRLDLPDGYLLDIYFNETLEKYSYTLVRGGQRVLGWDNAPHYPELANFPHHVHYLNGQVGASTLNGDPEHDLDEVRVQVEASLS
jgi:hypothetical protein